MTPFLSPGTANQPAYRRAWLNRTWLGRRWRGPGSAERRWVCRDPAAQVGVPGHRQAAPRTAAPHLALRIDLDSDWTPVRQAVLAQQGFHDGACFGELPDLSAATRWNPRPFGQGTTSHPSPSRSAAASALARGMGKAKPAQ